MSAKKIATMYAVFVGFMVLTNLVVRPAVKSAGVPLLKDAL